VNARSDAQHLLGFFQADKSETAVHFLDVEMIDPRNPEHILGERPAPGLGHGDHHPVSQGDLKKVGQLAADDDIPGLRSGEKISLLDVIVDVRERLFALRIEADEQDRADIGRRSDHAETHGTAGESLDLLLLRQTGNDFGGVIDRFFNVLGESKTLPVNLAFTRIGRGG
jgi:hypothetical protein